MMSNRHLQVSLNGETSESKLLNSGLPQGSVLAPQSQSQILTKLKMANENINIKLGNTNVSRNKYPKYLGVVLDHTLSYQMYLDNTAAKIGTRNDIIQKLSGTT